jgi:hypothetical protein
MPERRVGVPLARTERRQQTEVMLRPRLHRIPQHARNSPTAAPLAFAAARRTPPPPPPRLLGGLVRRRRNARELQPAVERMPSAGEFNTPPRPAQRNARGEEAQPTRARTPA